MEEKYARWLTPLGQIRPLSREEIMGPVGEEVITACFKEASEMVRAENRRLGLPEDPAFDPESLREAAAALAASADVGVLDYAQLSLERQRDRERDEEMIQAGVMAPVAAQDRNSLLRFRGEVEIVALAGYCLDDEPEGDGGAWRGPVFGF